MLFSHTLIQQDRRSPPCPGAAKGRHRQVLCRDPWGSLWGRASPSPAHPDANSLKASTITHCCSKLTAKFIGNGQGRAVSLLSADPASASTFPEQGTPLLQAGDNQQKALLYSSLKVLFRKSQESPWRQPKPRLHSQHSSPSPEPGMDARSDQARGHAGCAARSDQHSRAQRGPRAAPAPPAPAGPHIPTPGPGAAAEPGPAHTHPWGSHAVHPQPGVPAPAAPARRGNLRAGEGLRRGLGKVVLKNIPS